MAASTTANAGQGIQGKHVLVTGGNSGIGLHAAVELARRGAHVTITSRSAAKGEAALAGMREQLLDAPGAAQRLRVTALDLSSFESIRACAADLVERLPRLDVLVNNAGLMLSRRAMTQQGWEMTLGVNHGGHFLLTHALLPLLEASEAARVVNVASHAHKAARRGLDFENLQRERSYAGFDVYAQSKLANILFSNELSRRWADRGITSNALHPGVIRSGFAMDGDYGGLAGLGWKLMRPFMKGPRSGAATSVYLASAPELEGKSGGYYANCKPARSTRFARDAAAAERLWALTLAWVESHPST